MIFCNCRRFVTFSLLSVVAGAVHATQPTDVVTSDSQANTAMGASALANLGAPGPCTGDPCLFPSYGNTAAGFDALMANTAGSYNTALGPYTLQLNTTGVGNTALGGIALAANTTGGENTAVGLTASANNTTGFGNTAIGALAQYYNTTGYQNTSLGVDALVLNTTGYVNTAVGANALLSNTTGYDNNAFGESALYSNTVGANNTAFGNNALYANTTGKGNAAQGVNALYNNTTGIRNLAIGSNALYTNSDGSYDVALGFDAGYNATGNDNIYIANQGVAGESQTLRLGNQGTSGTLGSGILSAYIAGVATSQVTGSAVYITASGQLGVLASSERFKTDVHTMGGASDKLDELRPVTFKLKSDPTRTVQYGLIAEEVAKVYPELVIHGADGRINGVRYEELAPLLLNVVQRQQTEIAQQKARDAAQARQIASLTAAVERLSESQQSILTAIHEGFPRALRVARQSGE